MHLDNLGGIGNYFSPYRSGSSGANAVSGASAGTAVKAGAPDANSAINSQPVSLSDAAQALRTQDTGNSKSGTQSGQNSADFAQEQQVLTTLTDKSLAALGIISPADEASTKISFDSLSYQVSSSTTAAVAQQGQRSSAQLGSTQDASFIGEGHIVTANGAQYTFQVELQLNQSVQAAATAESGNANTTATANANAGTNEVGSAGVSQPSNLLAQLVNAMGQASGNSNALGANLPNNFINQNSAVSTLNPSTGLAAQPATPSNRVNWDAILKETASLFDLLDSLAAPGKAAIGAPTA